MKAAEREATNSDETKGDMVQGGETAFAFSADAGFSHLRLGSGLIE
jgi:hypothetical protein